MLTFTNAVLAIVVILTSVYFLVKRRYSYWSSIGAPYVEPALLTGNMAGVGKTSHLCMILQRFYNSNKSAGPFLGLFLFLRPAALITNLELVKSIMVKDFNTFTSRNVYYNEKDDPLSAHLFAIDGPKWRVLRSKMTPTFTSGKMKFMYPTVLEIGDRLVKRLADVVSSGTEQLEIKDYWARYTTDVIGTCAFGIECNTINSKDAIFREMGRVVFEEPRRSAGAQMIVIQFHKLANLLGIKMFPDEPTDFFMKVVKDTVAYREASQEQRKDFLNLMIEMKNNPESEKGIAALTINEIAAQAFVFFIAGYETSSTLLSFCSYELALQPDIQEKARQEIIEVLKRHDNQFTYEAMMEMKYVDQVLNESLRKYPPLTMLTRACRQDYPVAGTNTFIPKGCSIIIPVYAIQHDPEIYPDPEKYDPERFSPQETAKRHPFAFLPFGEGPRNCIGLRFGMMQARIGLASFLLNFRFTLNSRMKIPLSFEKNQFIIASDAGIWLNVEQISKNDSL